jgi:hypothetical protein
VLWSTTHHIITLSDSWEQLNLLDFVTKSDTIYLIDCISLRQLRGDSEVFWALACYTFVPGILKILIWYELNLKLALTSKFTR